MAGLMGGQMQPAQEETQPMNQQGMEDEPSVSPEEQAAYDKFVGSGLKILYSPKMDKQLRQAMKGGGNPIMGVAGVVNAVVGRMANAMQLDPAVLFHGMVELIEAAVELAEEAKLHEFSEQDMERVFLKTIEMFAQQNPGMGKQMRRDMQELIEAEKQGNVEAVVPGITEYARTRAGQ